VLEIETNVVRRLTTALGVRSQPSWSLDGRTLLFSATGTGADEVYVVGADGTALRRVTRGTEGRR
jgi:TolB protein